MNLRLPSRPEGALTLVEYVGVLVVIGLVTGILTPRVLAALDHARLSQTIQSLKAVRAATLDYAGEPARLGGWRGGWDESATNWADVLLAENLLTDPFAPPIARHSWVQVLTVPPDAEPGNGSAFDLGGTGVCSTPPEDRKSVV